MKYDAAVLSTNVIVEAVAETGMRAWLEHEQPIAAALRRALAVCSWLYCSARRLPSGFALQFFGGAEPSGASRPSWSRRLPAACFPRAAPAASLRKRDLDINVLMLVAVVGAMFLGEWAEAGTVVFLFAIAQWLESRSMDRAREAIRALMDLTPGRGAHPPRRSRGDGAGRPRAPSAR